MEDDARSMEMGSLDYLGNSELEDEIDGEDDLEEGEGFGRRVILKDMFTSNSEKRRILSVDFWIK